MAEYFAGGHLRFVDGEWRDDNGNAIEISRVRHGRVVVHEGHEDEYYTYCSECKSKEVCLEDNYCPNCGADMRDGKNV